FAPHHWRLRRLIRHLRRTIGETPTRYTFGSGKEITAESKPIFPILHVLPVFRNCRVEVQQRPPIPLSKADVPR
ncbi:MAG: hypothetical protein DMG13_13495, partial [Acidobacteria bacterium]